MDANILVKGEDYDKLPESYVIFITETDVMEGNFPIYHADRIIAETGKPLGDGTHIIYVNGAYCDDSPIGMLMHDFSCKEASDMYYKQLAEQVRYYKENEKGVETMCKIMEDLIEQGIDSEKKEIVQRMLEDGELEKGKIAKYIGLTLEQVEKIAKDNKIAVN